MQINEIINATPLEINKLLCEILNKIHKDGPINPKDFEHLAYCKHFHPEVFHDYEKKLISLLGLFYKTSKPMSILEELYSIYANLFKSPRGEIFTPIQASVYKNIQEQQYFSFSAPTSSGKSFLFRELILNSTCDIVIVVPSRALISEYMFKVLNLVKDDKSILVLDFIDNINIRHTSRRVYIITPERGKDLFKMAKQLNVGLFLFDEAQISEEGIRGMRFDALVKRIDKKFPTAKKVFTHPFIKNPEAQLIKHGFSSNADAQNYEQHSVGKIYLSFNDGNFKLFSPFEENNIENRIDYNDIVEETIKKGGKLLVYTSKNKIYTQQYIEEFIKYIDLCSEDVSADGKKIIKDLKELIGASDEEEKHSFMLDMMKKGIVIHHGSIPLKGRLYIEQFVNDGHAKICFATSTLAQGINMPFDAVWLDNFKFNGNVDIKILDIKNLIGRAGRTTYNIDSFDYGYVIVKSSNVETFCNRIKGDTLLLETSQLDQDITKLDEDLQDLAEAIRNDSFNDELQITEEQIERLKKSDVDNDIKFILDNFIKDGEPIKGNDYNSLDATQRTKIKKAFGNIYIKHLRRDDIEVGEKCVLSSSIPILLWRIQGKAFSQIVSLRHAYLSKKKERLILKRQLRENTITLEEYNKEIDKLKISSSQKADSLPNSSLKTFVRLFKQNKSVSEIDYDILVYDTYDYLDKVISLSLSDSLNAAFLLYYKKTKDDRALTLGNYIKYGTNNIKEIWLLRYGFEFDDIEWLTEYVTDIDENEIKFSASISELEEYKYKIIERYIA